MAAVVACGAVGVVLMVQDDDPRRGNGVERPPVVQAAVVSAAAEAVPVLDADPADTGRRTWLDLELPETTTPGTAVSGAVTWTTSSGTPISGQVDIQVVDAAQWTTVDTIAVESGSGTVDLEVAGTVIVRAVYAGSDEVDAATSLDVTVQAGDALPSTLGVSARPVEDTGYDVVASWATDAGVAIRGTVQVQQEVDGEWTAVGEIATGDSGSGSLIVPTDDPEAAANFRLAYPGGARFAAITSEPTLAIDDDVRTIPVSSCSTDHEIDVLGHGEGCHFTPVSAGTFVVGHDYLGNSWWNAMPIGTLVELEGAQAGVYEVVDRVIAPGRGAALGSAANWACGDACDVILQTCQGSNTGFTWLSRVS